MKILITGGTSSLSKALIPVLSNNHEVVTAGRKDCDIHLDLNDADKDLSLPQGIGVLIHTAANFGGKTNKEIFDAEFINALGTLRLCQSAVNAGVGHFVLVSSMFSLIKADSSNFNIYTLSKKHAEELAAFYCSLHSLPLTILRPSQIYGDTDDYRRHQPFLYFLIDKAKAGERIELYGSNDARRNFIHINDLIEVIARVIENKVEGAYCCSNTSDVTYSQIAQAAIRAFNSSSDISFLRDKPDIPDNIFQKDDALYRKISFYPQISIEEGIRRIAENKKY